MQDKKQLKVWRERRDFIYNELQEMGMDTWKPEGAFYILPKMKNANKAVWKLYRNHKLITYPGEWFGCPDRIRLSYTTKIEKLAQGLARLKKYLKNPNK